MSLLGIAYRVIKAGIRPSGCIAQIRPISGKAYREPNERPKPYDYKNKTYPLWYSVLCDRTTDRFDENTKLIVVDGPVAAGKTNFAKKLAEELDMYHIQDPTMDIRYINEYGYDMRQLDPQLPLSVKSFDERNFCLDPTHVNAAGFQFWKYMLRFSIYVDALAHLLSTGQGVVIERSPWSDIIFVEAMSKNGFMSKEAQNVYKEVKKATIWQLLHPHLVIYLDMPVSKVMDNLKKRGIAYEQNSKALTQKYLQDMEDASKTIYLPEMSKYAELLMYDWSEEGDIEVVVEDIERIDFEMYDKYDTKFSDWFMSKENEWAEHRRRYSDQKDHVMSRFNVPIFDAPELLIPGEDMMVFEKVWYSVRSESLMNRLTECLLQAPGMEYSSGFNPYKGESVLFKIKGKKYVPY